MEYLDNECKLCGGEIIDDPDTGNKICKHCGAEFFDKSRKQATSILGRFNIQNTSPQQNNQQQINQQEQQSSESEQQSNEPEKQLSALEKWELEHAKNEKNTTNSNSKFPLIKMPMGLRYVSAVIMYLQIFFCFLAGIIVAFIAGDNIHGLSEIFSLFTVVPISIVIWILFVGPMQSQLLKNASKVTIMTLAALGIITAIVLMSATSAG